MPTPDSKALLESTPGVGCSAWLGDMKDTIGQLIKEAKDIIQSEVNSTTPEYMALDRLCGAVELQHARMTAIKAELTARADGWRNAPSDPHNIANAVQVALLEVANSINAAAQSPNDPSSATRRPGAEQD